MDWVRPVSLSFAWRPSAQVLLLEYMGPTLRTCQPVYTKVFMSSTQDCGIAHISTAMHRLRSQSQKHKSTKTHPRYICSPSDSKLGVTHSVYITTSCQLLGESARAPGVRSPSRHDRYSIDRKNHEMIQNPIRQSESPNFYRGLF